MSHLKQSLFFDQLNIFNLPGIIIHHKCHQRMVPVPSIMGVAEVTDGSAAYCPNGIGDKSIILGLYYFIDCQNVNFIDICARRRGFRVPKTFKTSSNTTATT